jgi:hypothetical protein
MRTSISRRAVVRRGELDPPVRRGTVDGRADPEGFAGCRGDHAAGAARDAYAAFIVAAQTGAARLPPNAFGRICFG